MRPPIYPFYGDIIASALKRGAGKRRITSMSELARATRYSYEQIRKICRGDSLPGKQLHEALCDVLDLDADRMSGLLACEKFQRKHPHTSAVIHPPDDRFMKKMWPDLGDADKLAIRQRAEQLLREAAEGKDGQFAEELANARTTRRMAKGR